jgi:drug/metabolite transporter (DMT)-like permease
VTPARPAFRGTLLALVSAASFGVTTPLVQRLGRGVGSFATAALLYAGAAAASALFWSNTEARLGRAHLGRVLVIALLGAAVAPVLLAWGLGRTSGIAASLMLSLEAVFTILLARALYHEHVGRRVAAAAALLAAGGALLVLDHATGPTVAAGDAGVLGLAAIGGSALAWAADNALARPLSAVDPARVVAAKGAAGATLSLVVALAVGDAWPPVASALGLVAIGGLGYGLSLRLYLRAQRALGAGRTASVFASAPFCGAVVAWLLGEPATAFALAGGGVMIAGLVLHVTERHEHPHTHEPVVHEHAHRHDDGHHTHAHEPMPDGEHAHPHTHESVEHTHPHVPDVHHGHGHE